MQTLPLHMKISVQFSGGAAFCGNYTKRWNVYKNQTQVGQIKFHIKDSYTAFIPDKGVHLTMIELTAILKEMNVIHEQETKLSVN